MSGDHFVTIDLEFGYDVRRMTCRAPAAADCHAVYDCECEEYYSPGVEDGKPFHEDSDGDRHHGTFDPTRCDLKPWAEEGDEVLRGEVTFAVEPTWHGDHYTFAPVPEKDETPRLIEVTA